MTKKNRLVSLVTIFVMWQTDELHAPDKLTLENLERHNKLLENKPKLSETQNINRWLNDVHLARRTGTIPSPAVPNKPCQLKPRVELLGPLTDFYRKQFPAQKQLIKKNTARWKILKKALPEFITDKTTEARLSAKIHRELLLTPKRISAYKSKAFQQTLKIVLKGISKVLSYKAIRIKKLETKEDNTKTLNKIERKQLEQQYVDRAHYEDVVEILALETRQ